MNYYLAILFWLHLIGITNWVGAAFLMPVVIMPAAQVLEPPARLQFMGALSRRLGLILMASMAVIVVTGVLQTSEKYATFTVFKSVNPLSVKVFVAVLMMANGAYLGMVLPRRALALAPQPGTPPSPDFLKTMQRLGIHNWIQAALGVVVLLLVGLLISTR